MNTQTSAIGAPVSRSTKNTRRRDVVLVLLALLAISGFGAALTSASWSDDVFFASAASGAEFNLQGSLSGTEGSWVESDDPDSIELVIPASEFANLVPGQTRTVTLHVRNTGSVPATLTQSTNSTGGLFTGSDPAAVSVTGVNGSLAAGESRSFTLTLTTPSDWDASYQGATGTVTVHVNGASQ